MNSLILNNPQPSPRPLLNDGPTCTPPFPDGDEPSDSEVSAVAEAGPAPGLLEGLIWAGAFFWHSSFLS
jgi:hypothetical protein